MSSVTANGITCEWCGKPLTEDPPHTNLGCGQEHAQTLALHFGKVMPLLAKPQSPNETDLRDLIRRIVREELGRATSESPSTDRDIEIAPSRPPSSAK